MSVDDIVCKLAKYPNGIGAKYADRLQQEVERSVGKWRDKNIEVAGGQLPQIVNAAEQALLASDNEIYQRGGMLVRPVLSALKASDDRDTKGWRLVQITTTYLVDVMTRSASFTRWDARSKRFVRINAPEQVASTYLAREGEWKAPVLVGVVGTPFLRADGSICQTPGYDSESGLLFKPGGQTFPPIPERPSRRDARKALALLREPNSTFSLRGSGGRGGRALGHAERIGPACTAVVAAPAWRRRAVRRKRENQADRHLVRAGDRLLRAGDRTGAQRGGA